MTQTFQLSKFLLAPHRSYLLSQRRRGSRKLLMLRVRGKGRWSWPSLPAKAQAVVFNFIRNKTQTKVIWVANKRIFKYMDWIFRMLSRITEVCILS